MNDLIKTTTILVFSFLLVSCGENSTTWGSKDGGSNNEDTGVSMASVAPSSGPIAGGTTVTISGRNFSSGTNIRFGAADCTDINMTSVTQLTCVTPPNATGSVSVTVSNVDGSSDTMANAFVYGSVAPTFSSVSPNNYITTKSTTLTVNGTGFVTGMTVTVGGSSCGSVVINSASELTCSSPMGVSAGSHNVVVTNPSAASGTGTSVFTYRVAPTLTVLKGSTTQGAFQSCQSCHGNSGSLDISVFSSLRSFLVIGDPDSSVVLQRMSGVGGSLMPPGGMRPESELQALSDWILDGALDN